MRVLLPAFSLILIAGAAMAAPLPMTAKDLALMVRMGVPESEILVELEKRRLIAPIDAKAEKVLTDSGTPPAFIARLKSGNYTLSAEQAARSAQHAAVAAARLQDEETKSAAALAAQNKRIAEGNASAILADATFDRLRNNLVKLMGDEVRPFDAMELKQVRIFVIYNSAHWCGPCRAFTPKLVEFYNRMKPRHPEFEVIFASNDHDRFNMGTYMRTSRMPWPALSFEARNALKQYCGSGIPWLVAVDDKGRPLTQNGVDKQYIDPARILAQLETELLQ